MAGRIFFLVAALFVVGSLANIEHHIAASSACNDKLCPISYGRCTNENKCTCWLNPAWSVPSDCSATWFSHYPGTATFYLVWLGAETLLFFSLVLLTLAYRAQKEKITFNLSNTAYILLGLTGLGKLLFRRICTNIPFLVNFLEISTVQGVAYNVFWAYLFYKISSVINYILLLAVIIFW